MFKKFLMSAGQMLSVLIASAGSVASHEFWIAGIDTILPADATYVPTVWVGEHLEGNQFPWRPQAFARADWVSPSHVLPLHRARIGAPDRALRADEPGLHILSVATYGHDLTYEGPETFHTFLREIGREDVVATKEADGRTGPIQETYRRLSKTLVQFGAQKPEDRRVAAEGEWVRTPKGYTLYYQDSALPDQHSQVECRRPDGTLWTFVSKTDAAGEISVDLPGASACLINTVLLSRDESAGRWASVWISHFHSTGPGSI